MRVIHVVPAISDEASGPSYCVPRLCDSIIASGTDVSLVALDWAPLPNPPSYLKRFPLGFGPRKLGRSPQMRAWLENEAATGQVDILHNNSLWMMPNVYPGWACMKSRARLVVSPHGTVSTWAFQWHGFRKRLFWTLWQESTLRAAACFHATSEEECVDLRNLGFRQPIYVLPNGIDIPPLERIPSPGRRQLLFLGRIHPIKGVDILLRAWQSLQRHHSDWDLHFVGPDNNGYLNEMKNLAAQLGLQRLTFHGPLYGADKLRAYRKAHLFVLPTHSENFGMTVAEALAAGTPAIVTKGAPWKKLDETGSGWWIDIGLEPLVATLETALSQSPERLSQMGCAGRDWMLREYAWQQIGTKHTEIYNWIVNGGATPTFVRLN